jgi:hypothetical protein
MAELVREVCGRLTITGVSPGAEAKSCRRLERICLRFAWMVYYNLQIEVLCGLHRGYIIYLWLHPRRFQPCQFLARNSTYLHLLAK